MTEEKKDQAEVDRMTRRVEDDVEGHGRATRRMEDDVEGHGRATRR